jgi:putative transcriptional regulator
MILKINIDQALAKRRMTTTELSERLGIPEANLSMLRKSFMRDPRFRMVEKICTELQILPEDILSFERENEYGYKIV